MKKKVLFGTTNPSRLARLRAVTKTLPIEIVGLKELNINLDIEENGKTPEENAVQKVKEYFKASKIPTFSIDAGLYIDKFPEDKQPGVFVRRINGKAASDEEMLKYYINELNKVGGESKGKWIISIALAISEDQIFTRDFTDETYFTSKKSPVVRQGEPLGSLQISRTLNKYKSEITDEERSKLDAKLDKDLFEFLKEFIGNL